MSEEFLEESVVRPASDLFVWGNVSEEERMGKLLLAHPDANETERVELQRYNELFQRWYEKKGVRRGYIFDIAFRDGGVIPVVSLERMKAAVPYTMRATRRVIIMTPGMDINFTDLGTHIRNGSLRFQMLAAGTVVHLLVLTFWRGTKGSRDYALIPHTMFPIGYSPRTYRLDYLDGHRPSWQLTLAGGPQQLSTIYQHYLEGPYRDGLYDPDLGYTRGLWTPENLIHRVLSESHPPVDTGYRIRHPFPASPRRLPDLPAYVDRRQAYHRKMFETLRDNMENGITHWATKVMLGIKPDSNAGKRDPAVQSQIDDLAREAREIITAYRQFACPHFHVRSRFDAAFKAETRHSTFQIMSRFGQDRPDFRRQYHCTECSLALYCQHEELTQRKYANPLLDINLEPFYEIHEEIISCQYCRRFIGIKESETNVEFDENDRRISGRAVETDSDIRIREIITRVAQTLRIGNALSVGAGTSQPTKVKDDVLANYWLETLRPVIQVIYQEGKTKSKYPIGVYNLLIVLGYVVYSILVERTLPASLVVPGKGDVPNIETLIRATLDASSKSLYIHNILMQIPNAARREHFLKLIVEKYIWKILGEGASLSTQKRETVAIQRFFLEGIGGPTYGDFVKDNVDPADRDHEKPQGRGKSGRLVPRLYEFVHRQRVVAVDVPWKARIYSSMCYGDDGHWHDWDVNPRAANPMMAACAVCRVTIQQAFERFQKEDLTPGGSHTSELEVSAMARHEFDKNVINCPRGGFHQIDLDVCLRCGQTLDEISARVSSELKTISKPDTTPSSRIKRKVNPGRVPGPPKKARVDDLENLVTAYVKLLSRAAPTTIDQFKDAVTRVKASPQFSGGFVDEFRMRMGARVQGPDPGQVYRTAREVAAAILASCVESIDRSGSTAKELALEQVAFWRAAQGTVVAREYDEKFFQDRELDLEREQHERLLEFLSKTMDQKIADALLGDEVYDIDQPEYPEEPEDIDNEGELNGEDADREAS